MTVGHIYGIPVLDKNCKVEQDIDVTLISN